MSESNELLTKPVVKVTAQQQKQLKELVAAGAVVTVISSNEEYTAAGARLVQIKANIKQIDVIQTEVAGPLKEAIVKIESSMANLKRFFGVPRQKLLAAELSIKTAMNYYLKIEEQKRKDAQKLLDDAAAVEKARIKKLADAAAQKAIDAAAAARKKGDAQRADKIVAAASVKADLAAVKIASLDAPKVAYTAPMAAGLTSRKVWVYELYDIAQVPREYLMVDDKKVKAAIAAGERVIDGLIIKQDSSIVGTGK